MLDLYIACRIDFGRMKSGRLSALSVQRSLWKHYTTLLGNPFFTSQIKPEMVYENKTLETKWMSELESRLDSQDNLQLSRSKFPSNDKDFVPWFDNIVACYSNIESKLFNYLEFDCNLNQLGLYICFEDLVDSKFDDIVAISQIGIENIESKMSLAHNYWDEMGNGNVQMMHGPMFAQCCKWFKDTVVQNDTSIAVNDNYALLQNSNLLLCYSCDRQYATRLLGAITILEETAYRRFEVLVRAMKRLNVPSDVSKYQQLHADLDKDHGHELIYKVCLPLIKDAYKYGDVVGKEFIQQLCLGMTTRVIVASDYYQQVESILCK